MAKNKRRSNRTIQTGLLWKEKRTEVDRVILPFQVVETVNEPREKSLFAKAHGESPWRNKLIWGDNKYIMGSLLPQSAGKISLIYIDPPFATGADFSINIRLGDLKWTKEASVIEEKAYRDTWGRGLDSYLQMMYDRLVLMRELLAENGSIYVHLDWRVGHYVKLLMDEIFGKENFRNEIIWHYKLGMKAKARKFHSHHDGILWYTKNPSDFVFYEVRIPLAKPIRRPKVKFDSKTGRAHQMHDEQGRPLYHHSVDELIGTVWDILNIAPLSSERVGFNTQKPEALLHRIIKAASNEGDVVADFFCGSGTTGVVSEKLNRRWIMADLSKFAVHTARKRLLDIPDCRPFEILNLGKYQPHKLKDSGNGPGVRYFRFILDLYRAEALPGFTHLHGKKAGRMVHIGGVDSIITESEIRETLAECKEVGTRAVDFLGWDFEMGLHDVLGHISQDYGVRLRLVQIPKEALEVRSADREKIKFFDLNYLDVKDTLKGKSLTISLRDFVIANPEYLPDEVRKKIKKFTDYIDYWAVDFDYREDTLHNMWQSFRTRKHPTLETRCSHPYEKAGKYQVLVKVVDIFGNDTNKLIEIEV